MSPPTKAEVVHESAGSEEDDSPDSHRDWNGVKIASAGGGERCP